MSFEDLRAYFSSVQVCKIDDAFKYAHASCEHKAGSYCLQRMVVEGEAGRMTVSVAQKDDRCFPRNAAYDYSNCRIILMKIDTDLTDADEDGDKLEDSYIGVATSPYDRDMHVEVENMEPGEYYVFAELDWQSN